ncbi:cytochrome P450 [Brevibacterium limosum]|uniref:cytochrome P450 n=1 Tax=Brevibacterium limosum TaxID=2697565 RepID=UPI0014223A01|nr:cytochrome P450 [Brevibacterium limosum]
MTVDTHPAEAAVEDLDLFSDEILADTQPTHDRLRELAPVVHLAGTGVWAVTRYEGVRDALADPAHFSSTRVAFNPKMNEILRGTSLATDPPDHQKLRTALTENLSPRAVRGMKAGIDEKAETLVSGFVGAGPFNGATDLARAFPVSIVMDLIGVQGSVRDKLLGWGEAAFNMQGPLNQRALDSFPIAGELFDWTHNHIRAEDLAEGSIGRAVFAAADRGDIPHESCGLIIHQYIAAGMDTTITSLGNALVQLGRNPEAFERIREDPSLIPSAFAEVQRISPPIPMLARGVVGDVEIGGVTIPDGAQAALLIGAGNHDPRHYDEPDVFDPARNPVDHLAFGHGMHACAGQGLAKLEVHGILGALARNVRRIEIGQISRKLNNITRPFDLIELSLHG